MEILLTTCKVAFADKNAFGVGKVLFCLTFGCVLCMEVTVCVVLVFVCVLLQSNVNSPFLSVISLSFYLSRLCVGSVLAVLCGLLMLCVLKISITESCITKSIHAAALFLCRCVLPMVLRKD